MNCPKCGREMEPGIMYTEKYGYWTQQEKLPVFRAPKDRVLLRAPGDDSASGFDIFPFRDFPGTMLCRACKIAVFEYN